MSAHLKGQTAYSVAAGEHDRETLQFVSSPAAVQPTRALILIGQDTKSALSMTTSWLAPSTDGSVFRALEIMPVEGTGVKSTLVPLETKGEVISVKVVPVTKEASRNTCPSRPDALMKALSPLLNENLDQSIDICVTIRSASDCLPLARAIGRCFPRFSKKSSSPKVSTKREITARFILPDGTIFSDNLSQITTIVHYARFASALVDMPPNMLNTQELSYIADTEAHNFKGIQVTKITGDDLYTQGFGGIHSVGKGAVDHPPQLVHLKYRPEETTGNKKPIALVGKGVIYDTGGLSLKAGANMCSMKTDMGGAAAVLAGFFSAVSSNPTRDVHCILCIVENAIGPQAYRNDDILEMYSGLTVEVNNTDAEGRIILADGVSYAAKHIENLEICIDMATLTGAQGIATGNQHAGLFLGLAKGKDMEVSSFEDELQMDRRVLDMSRECGDTCYPLLFAPEFHKPMFKSEVADMKNSVSDRSNAQSSCAGWFIHEHLCHSVKKSPVMHIHVDIAFPAVSQERGTGFGVALANTLINHL